MHQFVVMGGVCLCANARREPHGAKKTRHMGRGFNLSAVTHRGPLREGDAGGLRLTEVYPHS